MRIDWWTLGLQAVNVLVLVWILGRFLFRPVAAMIETRRAEATRLLDEATAARAAADEERHKAEQAMAGIAGDRAKALQQASAEAEAEKASLLATARREADALRSAAETGIAQQRQQEATAIQGQASRLALDIAAKLLSRLPPEARVTGFVAGLAEGVAALPETVRATLGADGAPIQLTAPHALTEEESQACRAALTQALGHPVEIAVTADPGLVAGLEIDMPHAAVRNSFRADLDRIAAALAPDGQAAP